MKLSYHAVAIVITGFMTSYAFIWPDDERVAFIMDGDFLKTPIETMRTRMKPAILKPEERPPDDIEKKYPNPF